MAALVAACVVHELRPDAGSVGVSAIDKRTVSGPMSVRGLHAAVHVSRNRRGGELQVFNDYGQNDAGYWENEVGPPARCGLVR